jgi:enoyl-[acyl-carrier-protein] reductase (NADH)
MTGPGGGAGRLLVAGALDGIGGACVELLALGGRAVTAAEVAAAVAWLLSPASGRTTGTVLPVDGGWLLR